MKPPTLRTAVIVAAGLSSRLRPLTETTPKCLLPVGEGTMLSRSLEALRYRGIRKIYLVVGFEQEQLREAGGEGVTCLFNPFFRTTNNMVSLWFARDHLEGEEFLYLHADLVYVPSLLDGLFAPARAPVELLVDRGPVDEEAMKVRLEGERLVESSKEIPLDEAAGEWTGIARFTSEGGRAFFRHAEALLAAERFQAYDTAALTRMAREGMEIRILPTRHPWIEVDTHEDLDQARRLVARERAGEA